MQGYVSKRQKEEGIRGRGISATTIQKELGTFSLLWKFALSCGWATLKSWPFAPGDGTRLKEATQINGRNREEESVLSYCCKSVEQTMCFSVAC